MIIQLDGTTTVLTSCRVCGVIIMSGQDGLCAPHLAQRKAAQSQKREQHRKPSSQRGYGTEYRTARRELARWLAGQWLAAAAPTAPGGPDCDPRCAICGLAIHKCDRPECVNRMLRDRETCSHTWTAEHVIPLSRGGSATAPLLAPAHPACNYARRNTRQP